MQYVDRIFLAGGTNMMMKRWRQQILPKAKAFCTVKIEHQRAATILFYIKRRISTSSVSILSDNDEDEQSSHENSFQSRFSDNGNDDENINSNVKE